MNIGSFSFLFIFTQLKFYVMFLKLQVNISVLDSDVYMYFWGVFEIFPYIFSTAEENLIEGTLTKDASDQVCVVCQEHFPVVSS